MKEANFAQTLCELLAGLIFIILGIYVVLESQNFPKLYGQDYGADLFPKIIGWVFVVGGAWVFIKSIAPFYKALQLGFLKSSKNVPVFLVKLFVPILLTLLYVLMSNYLGAILSLAIVVALFMWLSGVRIIHACLISVVVTAIIWLGFVYLLRVPLPTGIL